MNYSQFHALTPKCLPTVETANTLREKYYPGMPKIEASTDPLPEGMASCEPGKPAITPGQLDEFAYNAVLDDPDGEQGPQLSAADEAGKALNEEKPDYGQLLKYVTGMGAVGKYERFLNDLAVSTKNEPTSWLSDRMEDCKPVVEAVKKKVVAMWTKFTDWIKSWFE